MEILFSANIRTPRPGADYTGPPAYSPLLYAKFLLLSTEEKEGLHPG